VTISVNLAHGTTNSEQWDWWTKWITWIFIAVSAAVCAWYAPLGYNYVLVTDKWTRKLLSYKDPSRQVGPVGRLIRCVFEDDRQAWEVYSRAIRWYCNCVVWLMLGTTTAVTAFVVKTWRFPSPHHKVQHHAAVQSVYHGALTLTTWPTSECGVGGRDVISGSGVIRHTDHHYLVSAPRPAPAHPSRACSYPGSTAAPRCPPA
jgi:hypothetical protein